MVYIHVHIHAPVVERRGAEEAVAVVGDEEAGVDVDLLGHELRAGAEGGAPVHAGVRPEACFCGVLYFGGFVGKGGMRARGCKDVMSTQVIHVHAHIHAYIIYNKI